MPFEIHKRSGVVRFFLNKQLAWEINPASFGTQAILKFAESGGNFVLELINAEYPNSGVRADFKALIKRDFGKWEMEIRFPHMNINQKIPFVSWLEGKTALSGKSRQSITLLLGKTDLLKIPPSMLSINHSWNLRMIPENPVILKTMNDNEAFGSLQLSITPPISAYWINPSKFENASWIMLRSPIGELNALSGLKFNNNSFLSISSYPFIDTGIILAGTREKNVNLLWGSNENTATTQIGYTPNNDGAGSLALYRSRFIKEYSNGNEPFALVADLGDQPQWYGATGTAFALAGTHSSTFTMLGKSDEVKNITCKAMMIGTTIGISGALSLPVNYNNPAQVTILPQDPVIKRTKTVKQGQIQTTGIIEREEPQDKTNWIYVNKNALKVNLKIDKPILFNLIRSQDFLNLQFEFVNFSLDGNLLKIDNKKNPSFLIVHFPSQHVREESLKEEFPLYYPVKFKRAGNSRIVFKVPSDYPAIPLTLEALLEWRNFDIQVNYRARWFNTNQTISELKSSLMNVSMVFSNKKNVAKMALRGAPLQLQTRDIKSIKTQQVSVTQGKQPMSALEVKVALASTPKGSGIMAISDSQLTNVLAVSEIEHSPIDSIKGAMANLFAMQPPSLFETSIEAPTFAEISPNQFAGFNHRIDLRDEFGEYDESNIDGLYIADEINLAPLQPSPLNRQTKLPTEQKAIQTTKKTPVQTKTISGIKVAVPAYRNYKNIVSSVTLKIPANLVLKQGQLFELWHSRMGIKLASGEVDESALNQLKTIRMLWSKWADAKILQTIDRNPPNIPSNIPDPQDLHNLVHLTSNYINLKDEDTNEKISPKPVKASQLMLSSLGAWFNYEFIESRMVEHIPLVAWLHRATMGRDQYIKIVNRGYLFPFGHKAVLIEISERQIKMINNVSTAVMISKSFIQVKQPELFYGKDQISDFVPFPFQRVELKDLEKQISKKYFHNSDFIELYKISDPSKPDPFKIEVDDASGQKIRMEIPLVFVYGAKDTYDFIVDHYSSSDWSYFTSSATHRPMAFARSLVPGDTTFETQNIQFSARKISFSINKVDFYPIINEASIYIKQMEELTGVRKPVRINLIDDNNLSMVFAKIAEGEDASLVFGNSEKSGGLITPNMAISGLSKLTGLTGNSIENINNLIVDVGNIFSLTDNLPKLFGIINFIHLLIPDVVLTDAIDDIKNTIEETRNQIEDLQNNVMSILARIDSELKKLNIMLQIIGDLLDETDIIGALQDVQKLSQAMVNYGVNIPGDISQAITASITVGKEIKDKDVQLENILSYVDNAQALKNKLADAGINVTLQLSQAIDQMLPLANGLHNKGLDNVEIGAVINSLGLVNQLFDAQNIIKTKATQIADHVLQAIPEIPNVKFQIKGDEVIIEYHWKPKTLNEYNIGSIFAIKNLKNGKNQIDVSVDSTMTKTIDLKNPPTFDVRASVKDFSLTIAESIQLNFKKVEFKSGMSAKPDVDVKFQSVPIRLIGALSFVNSLQNYVKTSQFDSGPYIDITSNGIVAGYNFAIPNVEVGIFALSNMMLGVKITLPFAKDPFTFGFNFCTWENPFKLMVSCFGGGGFFMIETTMQGLTRLEASFEFGAGISLNVGVASGSVEVMGGFYYILAKEITQDGEYQTQSFTAYLRMTGRLSIIGLIKVTLEFYLELRYEALGEKTTSEGLKIAAGSRLVGSATLSVKVEVLFFSKTVKVTVSRKFAGNDADPKFEQTYKIDHWQSYCNAFAS